MKGIPAYLVPYLSYTDIAAEIQALFFISSQTYVITMALIFVQSALYSKKTRNNSGINIAADFMMIFIIICRFRSDISLFKNYKRKFLLFIAKILTNGILLYIMILQYRFFRQIVSKKKGETKMKKTIRAFSIVLSSILVLTSTSVCLFASETENSEIPIEDGYVPIGNEDDFMKHWKDKEAAEKNKNVVFSYYADAEMTEPLDGSALPLGQTIYYTAEAKDGYFITHISAADGVSYIENDSFTLKNEEKQPLTADVCLAGDTNSDGKVSSVDIVRAMKFVLGNIWQSEFDGINIAAADTNRDGKINTLDIVRIMKLVSGRAVDIPEKYSAGKNAGASSETYYTLTEYSSDNYAPELRLINSVRELEEYLASVTEKYDTETTFEDRRTEAGAASSIPEILDDCLLNTDKLIQTYDEIYFKENTLVVYSYFCDSPDPYIPTFVEYRGNNLALCFDYISQQVPTEGGPVYAHEYCTIEKTGISEAFVKVEIIDKSVANWLK